MIDSFSFGKISVSGQKYTNDLIIFPNKIFDNWWREQGHQLDKTDLDRVIEEKPETLVIGSGVNGKMNVPKETIDYLDKHEIKPIIEKTPAACKTYNKLVEEGKDAAAALHLTC